MIDEIGQNSSQNPFNKKSQNIHFGFSSKQINDHHEVN